MNLVRNKQLLFNVPSESTKYRKKDLCVDNIKNIEDVYCPMCRNEKCVYISTSRMNSFYDRKKCKACCNLLSIPFKGQKQTIMLFDGGGTHCLHESRLGERKTISIFEEISPPITIKHIRT